MSWKLIVQLTNGNGKTREYVINPDDPGFVPDCVSFKCYWSQVQWPGVNELHESDISEVPEKGKPSVLLPVTNEVPKETSED